MKLIKRTYIQTSFWLIPVIVIGSIYCFYMIKYIYYEETDEFLTYEMERLIEYYAENKDLPQYHKVSHIYEDVKLDSPIFKDTLILEPLDNEMVPYRELYFTINHNGKYFTILLMQLMPGNDDIFEGTLLIVIGFLLLISLILYLMVNQISGKIWQPFYNTLNILTRYRITEPLPALPKSGIDEFNTLNETIKSLLHKIANDYTRTKEFNENASHELQTHLAMIRANTEKLLNSEDQETTSSLQLQAILNATIKLSKAQKSLMLLSKIGNLEYNNQINTNLAEVLHQSITLFQEAIEIRNLQLKKDIHDNIVLIDPGLAEILVNNLLKNAVKHNIEGGYISITLNNRFLAIENTGEPYAGNPENLLERFTIGTKGNLGIGLAIVKQICDLYQFNIKYVINKNIHHFEISFRRK